MIGRCGLVGEGVLLGVGFGVPEVHASPRPRARFMLINQM